MKKILFDLTSLNDNFSGIERFTANIAYQMVEQTENKFVLLFKNEIFPMFAKFKDKENVQIQVIKVKDKLIFSQLMLPRYLYKYKADVYLFLAFPAPFLFFSKKAISAIHDMGCYDCPETMKKLSEIYFKVLYQKASKNQKKIVTVSHFSKQRIMELLKCKDENVYVIYNGLSDVFMNCAKDECTDAKVAEKYTLPKDYLLCLSTIEPRKNMRLLMDAYAQLREEAGLKIDLVLAGRKGWKVENILENLSDDVKAHIHFTGFIDDEDLPIVYKKARCFVFPSIYEGFGIPPLEALAMGTDVISSDAASLPEVLKDGAIYFENNNIDMLKECLVKYTSGEIMVDEETKKQIVSLYDWKREALKLESML